MLTWGVVIALGCGVYGQRAFGMVALDPSRLSAKALVVVTHIPIAILSALVALQTVTTSGQLTADARLFGIATAAALASRRAPMFVIVISAAAVTALIRLIF